MNIGDEVTINGVVVGMSRIISRGDVMGEEVIVRLNCGTEIYVKEQEISTIRPKIEIPNKAEKPETCKGCLEPCIMYEPDMRACKKKVTERGEE